MWREMRDELMSFDMWASLFFTALSVGLVLTWCAVLGG